MIDPLLQADHWTFLTLRALRTPTLDQVMIGLTECGDAQVVWAVALAAAAWLASRRAWRPMAYGGTTLGGDALLNTIIKLFVHRTRPTDLHLTGADVYSFPSGHATTNTVLYGVLLILLWRQIPWGRWLALAVACTLFVAAICLSRLYLGAHWLSDVLGGLVFAALWLFALARLYLARQAPYTAPAGLLAAATLALVVASGVNIALNHPADLRRYALPAPAAAPRTQGV